MRSYLIKFRKYDERKKIAIDFEKIINAFNADDALSIAKLEAENDKNYDISIIELKCVQ